MARRVNSPITLKRHSDAESLCPWPEADTRDLNRSRDNTVGLFHFYQDYCLISFSPKSNSFRTWEVVYQNSGLTGKSRNGHKAFIADNTLSHSNIGK